MPSITSKLSLGFAVGFSVISFGLNENNWNGFKQYLYVPLQSSLKTGQEFVKFYLPHAWNKRKSIEAFENSDTKKTNHVIFELSDQEKQFEKQRVVFFNVLHHRMKLAEMAATQRGVTRKERQEIIRQCVKEFWPEYFSDYLEIVNKQLEDKKNSKQKMHI